jgi:hypothetical protein
MPIRVFISHSSPDKALANRFVRAMRAAINIPTREIRCTSLPQYALPVGSRVSSRLRTEIEGADVVVGLITPKSLQSSYVLFELGAAWGKGRRTFPLLAKGVRTNSLPELMKEINYVSITERGVVKKVLSDLAAVLRLPLRTSYASGFDAEVDALVRVAKPRKKKR